MDCLSAPRFMMVMPYVTVGGSLLEAMASPPICGSMLATGSAWWLVDALGMQGLVNASVCRQFSGWLGAEVAIALRPRAEVASLKLRAEVSIALQLRAEVASLRPGAEVSIALQLRAEVAIALRLKSPLTLLHS